MPTAMTSRSSCGVRSPPPLIPVWIQNGKMTDIAVLDASGEDKPYYKQALPLLDEMLAVQSAGVDTVSGATLTAEGLIGAVEDALGKAAG